MIGAVEFTLIGCIVTLVFNALLLIANIRMRASAMQMADASKALAHSCAWAVADNERLRAILLANGIEPGIAEQMSTDVQAQLARQIRGLH